TRRSISGVEQMRAAGAAAPGRPVQVYAIHEILIASDLLAQTCNIDPRACVTGLGDRQCTDVIPERLIKGEYAVGAAGGDTADLTRRNPTKGLLKLGIKVQQPRVVAKAHDVIGIAVLFVGAAGP